MKKGFAILLVAAGVRFMLFGNPASWGFYRRYLLPPDQVGWRQRDTLLWEYEKRGIKRNSRETVYLAVGSSQTGTLYNHPVFKQRGGRIFSIAGLLPLDLLFYRKELRKQHPRVLLLYLSEMEMGSVMNVENNWLIPPQSFYLFRIYGMLRPYRPLFDYLGMSLESGMARAFLSGLFPEYRHAYIFEGFLRRVSGFEPYEMALGRKLFSQFTAQDVLAMHKKLISSLRPEAVGMNCMLLEILIREFKDTPVVIVEGQYNPVLFDEKKAVLKVETVKGLLALSQKYRNVTFIPRPEIYEFEVRDFRDGVHVGNKEARRRYLEKLFARLDAFGIPASR